MAPGGPGNVAKMLSGIDTRGKRILDIVISAGAFTQIADKAGVLGEALRVLKPGGHLSCYDWLKTDGECSDDMRYWFQLETCSHAWWNSSVRKMPITSLRTGACLLLSSTRARCARVTAAVGVPFRIQTSRV